jgi:hypothetical protein
LVNQSPLLFNVRIDPSEGFPMNPPDAKAPSGNR